MDLDRSTGAVLKYGIALSIAILIAGGLIGAFDADLSVRILKAGTTILILIPFASILVSAAALLLEGDRHWFLVSLALICVTAAGMAVAWWF